MATGCETSGKLLLLLVLLSSMAPLPVHSMEFDVGGDGKWAIPSPKDTDFYNKWAAENRFQIGDTIGFKYKKDSVMVVTEEEYNKCRSTHPIFFSNNGKTEFKLDRSGLFYFISGVDGHCERGQKIIIRVIAGGSPPDGRNSSGSPDSDAAVVPLAKLPVLLLILGSLSLVL